MKKVISILLSIFVFTLNINTAFALSNKIGSDPTGKSQRQIIERTPWFDPTACDSGASGSSGASNYAPDSSCIGPAYPNVKDEAKLASAIDAYISSKRKDSPLNGKGRVFVEAGKKKGVNPILMVNIGRKETGFGVNGSGVTAGSNNPFGIRCRTGATEGSSGTCPNGWQGYTSFDTGIQGLANLLRENYIDKGFDTIETVFPRYAPPSENDTTKYINEVKGWMQEVVTLAGDGLLCDGSAPVVSSNPSTETVTTANSVSAQTTSSSPGQKGQTWVVGDSLTYGMANFGGLSQKLNEQGYSPNKINFQGGRSVNTGGDNLSGNQSAGSGLSAVDADKEYIKNSPNIVIALGTNASAGDFTASQKALIEKIKSYNPNANIRWIDIAAVGGPSASPPYNKQKAQDRNNAIYNNVSFGYSTISQFQFVWGDGQDPKQLASKSLPDPNGLLSQDGIHYRGPEQYSKYATFVTGAMSSSGNQGKAQTVVVLDPGHSGTSTESVDTETGLRDVDYKNDPEIYDVWDVSQKVKTKLEQAGYKVVLTKNSAEDSVGLKKRAEIANNAGAAIAVSIHNDYGQNFNQWGEVYVQKVGLYRGDPKVEFKDAEVAEKSQKYGSTMLEARKQAEGNSNLVLKDANFNGREGLEPGNIPLVMLFSKVPWVYNEAGGKDFNADKYAEGIFNGIKNSVPPSSGSSAEEDLNCGKGTAKGVGGQSIVDTASAAYEKNKGIPEYGGDILQYSDGNEEPWCADFVSWVYKESGNAFTGGASGGWRQAGVLNLQKFFQITQGWEYFAVGTKQPEPGDVAFYVGRQTPDGGSTQHVNIVIAVSGTTMTTIGGNEDNQLRRSERNIQLGDNSLVGFGRKVK